MSQQRSSIHTLPKPSAIPANLSDLQHEISRAHSLFHLYRSQTPLSILCTPLLPTTLSPVPTYLKLESEQITNSFKARGAVNSLSSISAPVVTASTGNHALAVLHAATLTKTPVTLFLPTNTKQGKLHALNRATQQTHATLEFAGTDCLHAEHAAKEHAQTLQKLYLSPYNNLRLIAGQGTIGVEIHESLSKLHPTGPKACYITVGGGGLISGVAAALKARDPTWRIVGCQPYHSRVMHESLRAGRVIQIESADTLSDGSAGGIEEGCLTFDLCAYLVDAWALVTEEEIAKAMRDTFHNHRKVIEGAAGVAVAGYVADEKWRVENDCKAAVVVICGGNVDVETFAKIVTEKN